MKSCEYLAIILIAMMLLARVSAAPTAAECKEERKLAINACKDVLFGRLPPACCQRTQVSHVECICPVITPKLAALIDVNRATKLIEGYISPTCLILDFGFYRYYNTMKKQGRRSNKNVLNVLILCRSASVLEKESKLALKSTCV
ncbi:hypothetical protein L1987_03038 [Smallanthus sonchifolius]|uniref:Uncharacterized protein n=1 Tax=Smallanthus sonchifolius TaxID=185202 RepID=A0ACB9K9J3_9ASTR|nr:hypothetical protein L1987_03038 [Smallanthus sonchifolius]